MLKIFRHVRLLEVEETSLWGQLQKLLRAQIKMMACDATAVALKVI